MNKRSTKVLSTYLFIFHYNQMSSYSVKRQLYVLLKRMVFISGKPSANKFLGNEIANSILACSIFNSSTRFKKYFLNASAARHR